MFTGAYSGRRVLVTGHTGFKGSWLTTWLLHLGAQVAGFSLGIPTSPANFQALGLENRITHFLGDIRDRETLRASLQQFKPEIVFHLAAQALVRKSFAEPAETMETNALGTMNILECLRTQDTVRAAVIITSDKCYRNVEWTWGYRENDTLGGDDPYSASKACAELITKAYVRSFFHTAGPRIATTRAGNVIGGGDWAPDRIVPDCVRAWSANQPVKIRQPQATRPWQHVLEPLSGYLWLGAKLWQVDQGIHGESFNFGPLSTANFTVLELIRRMAQHWPEAIWQVEEENQGKRESILLKLCCDKALHSLGWRPVLSFPETIHFTTEWYRKYYDNSLGLMYDLTCNQIEAYISRAEAEELLWVRE